MIQPWRPIAYSLMKCHEGSRPGFMRCRAASKTTNAAAPGYDRRAAIREIAVAGLAAGTVASAIIPSLLDPGRCRLVTAAARVVPGAREGFAVTAERAPVVRRGALLPAPDREGVPLQLVDVVEGVARVVVEARLYLLARLFPEGPLVADDLDALDLLTVLFELDALEQEKASFHPLVGNPSLRASGQLPRADQSVPEAPQVGARLGLLVGLSVVGVVFRHNCSSFPVGLRFVAITPAASVRDKSLRTRPWKGNRFGFFQKVPEPWRDG